MTKEFSIEELDRMYDEAMAWVPPSQAQPVDRSAALQTLLQKAKGQPTPQGGQLAGA
jgi:hypothetical protein